MLRLAYIPNGPLLGFEFSVRGRPELAEVINPPLTRSLLPIILDILTLRWSREQLSEVRIQILWTDPYVSISQSLASDCYSISHLDKRNTASFLATLSGTDAAPLDFPSIECPSPAILSTRRVGVLGLWGQSHDDQGYKLSQHWLLPGDSIATCSQ